MSVQQCQAALPTNDALCFVTQHESLMFDMLKYKYIGANPAPGARPAPTTSISPAPTTPIGPAPIQVVGAGAIGVVGAGLATTCAYTHSRHHVRLWGSNLVHEIRRLMCKSNISIRVWTCEYMDLDLLGPLVV